MFPKKALFITPFLALCIPNAAQATHVAAAEITYQCTGTDQFLVTLTLHRDCFGSELNPQQTLYIDNPCGTSFSITVDRTSVEEVSQLCATDLANSTCNGGSQPGIQRHIYSATVTLPPCDHITFSWTLCCRNAAIDNLVVDDQSTDMYIETTMYSQSFNCDDSPTFTSTPVPYLCQGLPATYSFGTSEANGDNVSYEFIQALEAVGFPCIYAGTYSYTEPIIGIVIDPVTGVLTFTPNQLGNFVITVLVTQKDDQGNIIGTVMRDMQFVIIPCANIPPDPATGTVANLSAGQITAPYAINACASGPLCFDLTIVDPDTAQSVTLESNVTSALPGSTFSYSGTNPITATICWDPAGYNEEFANFQIVATDNACPVTAFSTYAYQLVVCTDPVVEIPNVFSPNNDGPNDGFYFLQFAGFRTYRVTIYNRWGMAIHETSSFRDDDLIWRPQRDTPDGTYYYVFTGETIKGNAVDRSGYVTLVR
ncbi:MAG: gliding motility-associated C-terminal domain-containing protein [Flavobacteriales bacterium]